jgi:hypothetical protein
MSRQTLEKTYGAIQNGKSRDQATFGPSNKTKINKSKTAQNTKRMSDMNLTKNWG